MEALDAAHLQESHALSSGVKICLHVVQMELDNELFGPDRRTGDSTARESRLIPLPSSPPVTSGAAQKEADGREEGDAATDDEGVEGLV